MQKNILILDGQKLTLDDILSFTLNKELIVELSSKARKKISASYDFLNNSLKNQNNLVIYGINTGFGPMADRILGFDQILELQTNLILSHAVGMGEPINSDFVLAAMIVRLNTLAKGYSGVSIELLERLTFFINNRIIPVIPEHGAVGTSGDLVQLAHIALSLIGGGEVYYKNTRQKTANVYKKLKLQPYILKPKEGLSLINGTSVMSGVGSLLIAKAKHLLDTEISLGALSLELVEAYSDSIAKKLHELRPHKGQIYVSEQLRKILSNSRLLQKREDKNSKIKIGANVQELPEAIQEVYSLRCIAQILGPISDIIGKASADALIEVNSVTDNPIVDVENKTFLHGGNFHGDYIAAAMDQMKASIVKLTMFSERRINYFLNQKINKRFPPFLNLKQPGLTLALQGLQFVATSTTAYNQSLAFPHHVHSIPTNGDNQDVVSMGTDAALITAKVIENAYIVQTIEALSLAQAVDFLQIQNKLSSVTKKLYLKVREATAKITTDRELGSELHALTKNIKQI